MSSSLAEQPNLRGAKPRLDAETIIAAGLRLAAQPGTTAITVRELGTLLDADPTAIYRHFRNKEGLMQALLDRLLGLCLERVRAPRPEWRTRLDQLAAATLDVFTSYPAIGVDAIVLSTNGPAELDSIELILDALHTAGLDGDELVLRYAVLSSYMLSYAAGISRMRSLEATVPSDASNGWLASTLPVTAASHPHINAHRENLLSLGDRDIYHAGVTAILDAIETAAGRSRVQSAGA